MGLRQDGRAVAFEVFAEADGIGATGEQNGEQLFARDERRRLDGYVTPMS
jgi:hypothetical protein